MKHSIAGGTILALACLAISSVAAAQTSAEAPLVYVTHSGDTLVGLGQRYLIDDKAWRKLQQINHVRTPRHMPVGQRLNIPRELLRYEPISLRVASFSGPVTIGAALPVKGQELAEGIEITTGPRGFISLTGAEGSRITLPSNTKARLLRARRYLINRAPDIEFAIGSGRADIKAAPQGSEGRFRARTPVASSAVRGTEFRISYKEEGGDSGTEVLEGNVGVATPSVALAIPAGQGALAKPDGSLTGEALLPAVAVLDSGQVKTEEAVSFALKRLPGATAYHVQIARDAGFADVVDELTSAEPAASFAGIANGTFFVRAGGVSASGLEGYTEAATFRRQRVGLKADVGVSRIPGALKVNWQVEGEGTSTYSFQLFPGDDDTPLFNQTGMTETGISLAGLKPGAYRWRVGVLQVVPEGSAEVWMPLQKFTVSN